MGPDQKIFELMIECSKSAGRILMNYFSSGLTKSGLRKKSSGEIVTSADFESNRFIISKLGKEFPNIPILSEESPDDLKRTQYPGVFIIDPLDGTNNFVEGIENFSVSIAYTEGESENHLPVFGVVYKPVTDELYAAQRGKSAIVYKGNEEFPLRVSDQNHLSSSKLICSAIREDEYTSLLKRMHPNWTGSGSAALMISFIAAGKADWYAHVADRKISEYDICAAHLIISESGGQLTDCYGDPVQYNKTHISCDKGILATNGKIHTEARMLTANIMENNGFTGK